MNRINDLLLSVSIIFLLLIFFCIGVTDLFFALNLPHFQFIFPIAAVMCIGLSWSLCKKYLMIHNSIFLISVFVSVVIFLIFEIIALSFYDISWDGQAYHLEAILKMKEGWNSIWMKLDNSLKADNIFINHYPRGDWYVSFSLYALTGKIEGVKVFNFLWFIICWFLCCSLLNRFIKLSFLLSVFVSLLAAANPVTLVQLLSNYVDGQLAMTLTLTITLCAFLYYTGNFLFALLLFFTTTIAVNLKFTAPFYVLLLAAGCVTVFVFIKNFVAVKKICLAIVAGFLFGIFVIGYSPYVSNTIEFGNPVYPIADKSQEKINSSIANALAPVSFSKMNRVQKLVASNFSKGVYSRSPKNNQLKIPGTFSEDEIMNYVRPDAEVAGMGPFFSLALLLSVIALGYIFIADRKIFFVLSIGISFILISVFITPVGWLPRYAPQFYLISVFVLIAAFSIRKRFSVIIAGVCFVVLLMNNFMIANYYFTRQAKFSSQLKTELKNISDKKKAVRVFFGRFNSNRQRFNESGIRFTEVKSIHELDSSKIYYLQGLNDQVAVEN
ncbi:MAG TPA: hypothetical protein DCQ93_03760 [Bacteroidetes bacterium]|nr:hypothetical protein [Bacteroidota bacterium]